MGSVNYLNPKDVSFIKSMIKSIYLGVVLRTDVEMRVHINSSLHVDHVYNMRIDVSYFFDDHVRRASGSTKLSKVLYWWKDVGWSSCNVT